MPALDIPSLPLDGVRLIEASAGTGKTYTIAALYLRLVLERGLAVPNILVVTFTRAATAELRERVRQGLVDELERRIASHDDADTVQRLRDAIQRMDEAAIFTIHGFCQRMLADHAFDSGAPFDAELSDQQGELIADVVDSFWRQRFYAADGVEVEWAWKQWPGGPSVAEDASRASDLRKDIRQLLKRPGTRILPPLRAASAGSDAVAGHVGALDPAAIEGELYRALTAWCQCWPAEHAEAVELLRTSKALSRAEKTYRVAELEAAVAAVTVFSTSTCTDGRAARAMAGAFVRLPDGFELFTSSKLAASLKKNQQAPEHSLFDAAEALWLAQHRFELLRHVQVLSEARDYVETELAQRKQQRNLLSYDDLLSFLGRALAGSGGERLARRIAAQYPVALIDEFQDTDPTQYAIFRRIYSDPSTAVAVDTETGPGTETGSATKVTGLFMIGDPKQAIYSFRGADLFTYINARRHTDADRDRFTLDTNWRSTAALIAIVNRLFERNPAPFLYNEDIPFEPVQAAGKADQQALRIDGQRPAALKLWLLPRVAQPAVAGKPPKLPKSMSKDAAKQCVAAACAAQIAALLRSETAMLGERPLGGGDIAVLVRANSDAALMRDALDAAGVASVLYSPASVYASAMAAELDAIIAALAEPSQETLLRRALATTALGGNAALLDRHARDSSALLRHLEHFIELHHYWARHGFMPCLHRLMARYRVSQRLLASGGGERSLTNLLHLIELLQVEALGHPGMDVLRDRLQTLREEANSGAPAGDEQQLRLESDADLVRVVTIHKSKGLQYPLVFLPFPWSARKPDAAGAVEFHDSQQQGPSVDLGSTDIDTHRALARRETLAEDLRMLYVALTRAEQLCWTSWGAVNQAEYSALAWLLHPAPMADGTDAGESVFSSCLQSLSDADIRAALLKLAVADAGDTGELPAEALLEIVELGAGAADASAEPAVSVPTTAAAPDLSARQFSARIDVRWRVNSFSGLVAMSQAHASTHATVGSGVDAVEPVANADAAEAAAATGQDELSLATEEALTTVALEGGGDAEAMQRDLDLVTIDPVFRFPRGPGPGTCLHAVFEDLDFPNAEGAMLSARVGQALLTAGLGSEWQAVVCDLVADVLDTSLNDDNQLSLRHLTPGQCRAEMEFSFPLHGLASSDIVDLLQRMATASGQTGATHPVALDFPTAHGLMKGFIDLVFEYQGRYYLLDYKSNHLGDQVEDYNPAALAAAMADHRYDLQLLIYSLALHRFLCQRLPDYDFERHFGGGYYLFLRGMRPANGPRYGVSFQRPNRDIIEQLDRVLGDAVRV